MGPQKKKNGSSVTAGVGGGGGGGGGVVAWKRFSSEYLGDEMSFRNRSVIFTSHMSRLEQTPGFGFTD